MKKTNCINLPELDFGVSVDQTGVDRFTVTYGAEVHKGLNYTEAAKEFGLCVFHALACMGKLDNR